MTSLNDKVYDWGVSQKPVLGSYSEAKNALTVVPQEDYARLGTWNEGLAEIVDLMADSALWLDSRHSVSSGEPRVRNLGGGDRTAVSGAVIYDGKMISPFYGADLLTASDVNIPRADGELVVRVSHRWVSDRGGVYPRLLKVGLLDFYFDTQLQIGSRAFPVPGSWVDDQIVWIRVINDGDAFNSTGMAVSWALDQPDEPTSWTSLGESFGVAWATTTRDIIIGNYDATPTLSRGWGGEIHRVIVRDYFGGSGDTWLDVDLKNVPNWSSVFTATTGQTVTLNTTAADYGAPSALDAKLGSVLGAYVYDGAAVLPGIGGNYLSTPDAAELDITGDIEIVQRVGLDDWSTSGTLNCKRSSTDSGAPNWQLSNITGGQLTFAATIAGVARFNEGISVAHGFMNGVTYWVKVTRDASTADVRFFWAADQGTEPTSWTELSRTVPGSNSGAMTANTSPVEIGSDRSGTVAALVGSFHRTIVRDGIDGTTVLDVDMSSVDDYATSFTATTGQTVTVNSTTSDTNDPLLLTHTGVNYLYTPGIAGDYTRTTDVIDWATIVGGDVITLEAKADIPAGTNCEIMGGVGTGILSMYVQSGGLGMVVSTSGPTNNFLFGPSSVTLGRPMHYRVTYTVSTGIMEAFESEDGVTWVSLGSPGATAGGALVAPTSRCYIGSAQIGVGGSNRLYSAKIVTDGVTHLDVNTADDITDAGATTFTATSGDEFTVTRGTSGRKTVLVTRPVWLFGTDDYMEVADNDLLNFGADVPLTLVVVARQWATPTNFGRLLDKRGAGTAGYIISALATALPYYSVVYDGTNSANTSPYQSNTPALGELAVWSPVLDRDADTYTMYVNTLSSGGPASSASVGAITNTQPLRVGQTSAGANQQDVEIVAVAIFRRALTTAEITAINNFYGTV